MKKNLSQNICHLLNFKTYELGLDGWSIVPKAKQRKVSRPVPYVTHWSTIRLVIAGVSGTFWFPTRTCVQRFKTPSGAP